MCTAALDEVGEALSGVCLRWITKEEKVYSTFTGRELSNRTGLNVVEWFGVDRFGAIHVFVQVVPGSYGISPLSRPLQSLCPRFYRIRFYENDLLTLGITQRKIEHAVKVVNEDLYFYIEMVL